LLLERDVLFELGSFLRLIEFIAFSMRLLCLLNEEVVS
jgi:hypothetical protein